MALTDAEDLSPRPPSACEPLRLRVRRPGSRASTAPTQRMAGTAFVIRVASAVVVFLSQILLARWMGSFEFGIYVYVWTWLLLVGDIVHLGLPLIAQRYIPEYTQRNAARRAARLPDRQPLARRSGSATAVALLGAALVHALDAWLDPHTVCRSISPASRCRSTRSPDVRRRRALLQLDRACAGAAFAAAPDRCCSR